MKYIYITAFSLFTFFGFSNAVAQPVLDVKVVQQPSEIFSYIWPVSSKGIKRSVYVRTLENGIEKHDTLNVTEYTPLGDKLRFQAYNKNKKEDWVEYLYPSKTLSSWRQHYVLNPSSIVVNHSFKNKAGKDIYFENATVTNADTTSKGGARFTYNKDSLLIKREDFTTGHVYRTATYQYAGKDMVMAELRQNNNPAYRRVKFIYDSNHLPVQQIEYFHRINAVDSLVMGTYTYDGRNLIGEVRPDPSGSNKQIDVSYSYDGDGRIAGILSKKDTLYQRSLYQYDGKKLAKTVLTANTPYIVGPGLYSLYFGPSIRLPLTLVTNYTYNNKGNLVKIEETLNGELKSRKVYEIEYY